MGQDVAEDVELAVTELSVTLVLEPLLFILVGKQSMCVCVPCVCVCVRVQKESLYLAFNWSKVHTTANRTGMGGNPEFHVEARTRKFSGCQTSMAAFCNGQCSKGLNYMYNISLPGSPDMNAPRSLLSGDWA